MAKNIEITKPMTIEVNGLVYTLEFSRSTVILAERAGFVGDKIADQPMTMLPLLFYAAFKKNQPHITREETDNILFDELGGLSTEEVKRLVELYNEPTRSLIRTADEEDGRKNVKISL